MPGTDTYDVLVIGSGEAGKYLAWTMASEGHRTAVVERELIGGSCPNIACLPSQNIIHSAKVRSFVRSASDFGVDVQAATTNMARVQARKRSMVDGLRQLHLDRYHSSGADLIMGEAHVGLNESEARRRGIAYRVLAMPMGLCLGPAPSRHRVG